MGPAARPRGAIALEKNAQAIECQHVVNLRDIPRVAGYLFCQPPGGNHLRLRSQLSRHSLQDSIYQPDIAIIKAALQMSDGIGPDHLGGTPDVYSPQPCCACKQGIGADAQPRRNRAAQVLALGRDYVECGSGPEIDDNARSAIVRSEE